MGVKITRIVLINRAAMGRARFLIYLFFFVFSRFCVERPKLPLGQTSNHATWDDYYTDNVMDTEVNCLAVSSKRVKRFEGK